MLEKHSKSKRKKIGSNGNAKAPSVLRADCFRVLDEANRPNQKVEPKLSKEVLLRMYRQMQMTRFYDERGMLLQRQGRIGFYVPSFGQEAIQIGTVAALKQNDWIFLATANRAFLFLGEQASSICFVIFGEMRAMFVKADRCRITTAFLICVCSVFRVPFQLR